MSEAALLEPGVADPTPAAHRLHFGVLEVAGRLGALLGKDHEATGFLAALGERPLEVRQMGVVPARFGVSQEDERQHWRTLPRRGRLSSECLKKRRPCAFGSMRLRQP